MKTSKIEKNHPEMNKYYWERLHGVRGDSDGWSFLRCDSSPGGIKFRWKDYNQKVSLRACVHACAVCLLRLCLRVSFVLYDMVRSTLLRYLRYGHHCILEVSGPVHKKPSPTTVTRIFGPDHKQPSPSVSCVCFCVCRSFFMIWCKALSLHTLGTGIIAISWFSNVRHQNFWRKS